MALRYLRLRRTLASLYTFHGPLASPITSTPPPASLFPRLQNPPPSPSPSLSFLQSRAFTGTRVSPMSTKKPGKEYKLYKEGDEITEDTILFEGCDFNHWLITVDFPKDNPPTREQMIETYERICAQGLNISVEEAKKKIYACSTTTYQGFQAVMTEEESEKFTDVPGVVFVLPDSYIDPQNKEYGGDKYENGVITPRPPPIQYQTQRGGRNRDRNRNQFQEPRYNQQQRGGPMPNQGPSTYGQQGSMQGGGWSSGPAQNYPPQQNYGPPGQGGRQNYTPQQNYGPAGQGERQNSPSQQNYGPAGHGERQYYPSQQNYGPAGQGDRHYYPSQQNYGPPGQGGMPMNNRDYASSGRGSYEPNRAGPVPSYQGNYNQGQQGNPSLPEERGLPQGGQRDYASPEQRAFKGDNRNYSPTNAGPYGQDANTGSAQGQPNGGQMFSQMEQRNAQGEQGSYAPPGQINQGRY